MNLSGKRAGLRSTRCWQVTEGLTDERRLDPQRIEGADVTQVAAAARRMFAPEGLTSLQCEPTAGADDASVREWVAEAVGRIEADLNRSADTHLIALPLPGYPASTCTSRMSRVIPPAA